MLKTYTTPMPNSPSLSDLASQHIMLLGPVREGFETILTPAALRFVANLQRLFHHRREELLRARVARQERLDAGELPTFLPETQSIRDSQWQVAPIPPDLQDRRVEITGPVDRKMVINALNSGANCFMADFEDSHSPTWDATIQGQINLADAIDGTIHYTDPASGKHYKLNTQVATLMVRPRGWHLEEKHFLVDGRPVSASLFDFGLFFFHNAQRLIFQGNAALFLSSQAGKPPRSPTVERRFHPRTARSGIPRGTIRATVLIETIMAAFEMDEILYELRDHAAGLNCGRWDYIFSFIKRFRNRSRPRASGPRPGHDDTHFMHSYSRCDSNLPSPRRAAPLAAWRLRFRSRATRRPTRRHLRKFAPTSDVKLVTGTTAPGSLIQACRRGEAGIRCGHEDTESDRPTT